MPPCEPRVAMLRMKMPGSWASSFMRMRSPMIEPPEYGLLGSIAITPTRLPAYATAWSQCPEWNIAPWKDSAPAIFGVCGLASTPLASITKRAV